jgi:predicted membrane protein
MNMTRGRTTATFQPTQLAIGLLLVILGVLFLVGQAGLLNAGDVVRAGWPAILVLLGVAQYLHSRDVTGPLVVIGTGFVLLLFTTNIVPGSITTVIGPLLLISAGVWIMLGRARASGEALDDTITSYSMFGDVEITRRSNAFAGGTIVDVFGDTTVDLRAAVLAPEGAQIDVLTAFADVKIIVPRGWRVALSGIPAFGDYSDNTDVTAAAANDAPLLSVNVFALFGDLKIQN